MKSHEDADDIDAHAKTAKVQTCEMGSKRMSTAPVDAGYVRTFLQRSPVPGKAAGSRSGHKRWPDLLIAAILFVLIFAVYISDRDTINPTDPMWAVHIANSVIREGNTNLDEYAELIDSRDYYAVIKVDGHLHSWYPLGTPLLAVPFMLVGGELTELLWDLDLNEHLLSAYDRFVLLLQLPIASFISGLVCVVIYFIGRLYLGRWQSALLMLIAAFSTALWSTASRGLWQHGPTMLMLSIALLLLLLAEKKPWLVQFASIPLAFSGVIRPTNAVSIVFLSLYVLIRFRRYFVQYLLWAMLIAIPMFLLNYSAYGSFLSPYQAPGGFKTNPNVLEGMAGNLLSPSRGLLIYSPVFLLAIHGLVLKIKRSEFALLDALLLCILFFHWLAVSTTIDMWWAGGCYGPRFLSDMIPYLIYFLFPILGYISPPLTKSKTRVALLLALLVSFGVFVHWRGATEPAAALGWNWRYENVVANVDDDPSRVWDWSDPQFMRGLRPPRLSATPPSLFIALREGQKSPALPVTVVNPGDKTLWWQAKVPDQANFVSISESGEFDSLGQKLSGSLPGLASRTLHLSIDLAGLGKGEHSLGAILISGSMVSGKPVRGSPITIPLSVKIGSGGTRPDTVTMVSLGSHTVFMPLISKGKEKPWTSVVVPSADILANGQSQAPTTGKIQFYHGTGWYDLKHQDAFAWRWASSPAEIYVFSPTRHTVRPESTPVSLYQAGASAGLTDAVVLRLCHFGSSYQKS